MGSIFQVPSTYSKLSVARSNSTNSKKRKRGAAEPEDEDVDAPSEFREPVSLTSLTANQAAQYHLAGADPSDGLPDAPFPHHPKSEIKTQVSQNDVASSLPKDPEKVSLRQRHLSVLTTIMHHSLLKGDYQRAGRAWGMLLRSGPTAVRLDMTTMDLHSEGRWEIAAEILLRRDSPIFQSSDWNNLDRDSFRHNSPAFTETGLRAARDLYERLIVQFPIHPNRKNTHIDFYLAMFSLWIYEVTEKAESERQRIEQHNGMDEASQRSLSDSMSEDGPRFELHQVLVNEVQGARRIANRLDDLISSPPYDKDPGLLRLRSSVSAWVRDLADGGS